MSSSAIPGVIKVSCGQCGARYGIAEHRLKGRTLRVRCKGCGAIFEVRDSTAAPPPSILTRGERRWFVVVDRRSVGPMSAQELRERHASGDLSTNSHVWRPGQPGWLRVREIEEFADLIDGTRTDFVEELGEPDKREDVPDEVRSAEWIGEGEITRVAVRAGHNPFESPTVTGPDPYSVEAGVLADHDRDESADAGGNDTAAARPKTSAVAPALGLDPPRGAVPAPLSRQERGLAGFTPESAESRDTPVPFNEVLTSEAWMSSLTDADVETVVAQVSPELSALSKGASGAAQPEADEAGAAETGDDDASQLSWERNEDSMLFSLEHITAGPVVPPAEEPSISVLSNALAPPNGAAELVLAPEMAPMAIEGGVLGAAVPEALEEPAFVDNDEAGPSAVFSLIAPVLVGFFSVILLAITALFVLYAFRPDLFHRFLPSADSAPPIVVVPVEPQGAAHAVPESPAHVAAVVVPDLGAPRLDGGADAAAAAVARAVAAPDVPARKVATEPPPEAPVGRTEARPVAAQPVRKSAARSRAKPRAARAPTSRRAPRVPAPKAPRRRGLSSAEVDAGMRRAQKALDACQRRYDAMGLFTLALSIDGKSGLVRRGQVRSTFVDDDLAACLIGAVRASARFPTFDGPSLKVTYPLVLR